MSANDYASVMESARCAMFACDLQGIIEQWNAGACRLYGYNPAEVLHTSSSSLFAAAAPGQALAAELTLAQSHGHWQGSCLQRHQSGREFAADLFISLRSDFTGSAQGFLIVADAPPASPAFPSPMLDAQGRLAGGLAHDFNNLMSVIRGYSEMLLEDLPPPHPSAGMLSEIVNACRRAASMTLQLTEFAGKQQCMFEPVDTAELIRQLSAEIRERLGPRGTLVLDLPPDGWPVYVDRLQWRSVLWNLATNACEAMPDGGTLTIRTRNERAQQDQSPDDYLAVSVNDTGRGMDEDIRRRLFEPYFTTKPRAIGVGLGLATSYGILKAHRGRIEVESAPQQGSTFRVWLPRYFEAPPTSSALLA